MFHDTEQSVKTYLASIQQKKEYRNGGRERITGQKKKITELGSGNRPVERRTAASLAALKTLRRTRLRA